MKQAWKGIPRSRIWLLAWGCAALLMAAYPVHAAESIAADGILSLPALPANAGDVSVSGNRIVWYEPDAQGVRQIRYADLGTGESRTITSTETRKEAPDISGSHIVWTDKAGLASPEGYGWNVLSYDLQTGDVIRVNSKAGIMANPSVDGNDVVWYDTLTTNMYHYEWSSGTETKIGKGVHPQVSGKKVAFKSPEGALSLLMLPSGEVRTLVKPEQGAAISSFVFNGDYVVWHQIGAAGKQKVVMLSVNGNTPQPRDLTAEETKVFADTYLTIGRTAAAWIEERGGKAVLVGADLRTGRTFVIDRRPGESLYPFWGDRLLYGYGGKLETRAMPQLPDPGTGTSSSGGWGTAPTPENSAEQWIGPYGGELSLPGGKAKLIVPKGALAGKTLVSVKLSKEPASIGLSEPHRIIAGPVEIEAEQPFAVPATLEIGYERDALEAEPLKLALYAADAKSGQWTALGSHVEPAAAKVSGGISARGRYAIVLNEVSFADLTGHWARTYAEVLASRGVVEGMTKTQYAPEETLTRAQFAKLLVGALGGKPVIPAKASFQDVAADYWGYGWIEAAAQAGFVEGDGGRFFPEEPLTREQMTAMLVRASGAAKEATSADAEAQLSAYADQQRISAWARASMALGVKLKLLEGDQGRLMPDRHSTRAQAAAVIYRFMMRQNKL